MVVAKNIKKVRFGLVTLGYCRNMKDSAPPSVDIKSSFKGNVNTMIISFRGLYTNEHNYVQFVSLFLNVNPSKSYTLDL